MKSITRKEAKECVGKGWSSLIDELYDAKPRGTQVLQVKEKFGELRFYVVTKTEIYDDAMDYDNIISEVTKKSRTVCEDCGSPNATIKERQGWFKAQCNKCYMGENDNSS